MLRIVFDNNYFEENNHFQNAEEQIAYLFRMCGQLQSLEIVSTKCYERTLSTLLDFIQSNPMICDLHVHGDDSVGVMPSEVMPLISEHAPLVKLHLETYSFMSDDVIKMIQELNSLKEFFFQMNCQLQYDQLVTQLDSEWQLVFK